MSIKIVLLRSGEQIISDVHEIVGEDDKSVAYSLTRPCTIHMKRISSEDFIVSGEPTSFDISLYPWVPLSTNENIVVPIDYPVGFADPIDQLVKMYTVKVLDVLKEKENDQTDNVDEQPDSGVAN
jgi:hypothetical protein